MADVSFPLAIRTTCEWLLANSSGLSVAALDQLLADYRKICDWTVIARAADLKESLRDAFGDSHEATRIAEEIETLTRAGLQ